MSTAFETKDSGKRVVHESGMVRDVADDKIDYTLALDGPMFERYAQLMHRGQKKYGKRNWMKANSQKELDRARESLTRHFFQYLFGQTDEDHAAAVMFNINEIEYIKGRLDENKEAEVQKCTYPYCSEPRNEFSEHYMHFEDGIIWPKHPHYHQ